MKPENLALAYALTATLCFSLSTIVFAAYSRRFSPLWMNAFKCGVAFVALAGHAIFFGSWPRLEPLSAGALALSGALGLFVGDLFLLQAFTRLGAGRTLMIYGFQPLTLGLGAYAFFGQRLRGEQLVAVAFMMACLMTLSLEKYRAEKKWEAAGLLYSLIGLSLDNAGVLLSRWAFEREPGLGVLDGNFVRCSAAAVGFAGAALFVAKLGRPLRVVAGFRTLVAKEKAALVVASFSGTFLSLFFWLTALRMGHLASIAAIGITGPLFATAVESAVARKPPSPYVWVAFGFFATGAAAFLSAT